MATKAEEKKAWKKLKNYPNGKHRVLQVEYRSYETGEAKYRAYLDGALPYGWSPDCESPMEAVNTVIKMFENPSEKEETKDESNL